MRWVSISAVVWFALAAPAWAQSTPTKPTIDVQIFHPAPGGNSFFTIESADVNSSLGLSVGLSLNYARNPLAIQVLKGDGSTEEVGLVIKNRLDANLAVGFGLFDIVDIGLVMPFVYQGGFDADSFSAVGIDLGDSKPKTFTQGDLRIVPKIRFLRLGSGAFSAAVLANVVVPTAKEAPYASEAGLVIAPALALSGRAGPLRLALNAGYRMRDKTEIQTLVVDDQLTAGLAMGVNLSGDPDKPFEIVGEVFGQTPADDPLAMKASGREKDYAKAGTTVEGEIGLRMGIGGGLALNVSGGGGILPGYGAPAPRVFVGVTYYSGDSGLADADKDGVPDDADQCPDRREDRDGFEDADGCPDLDNDKDNVVDEDDQCPNEPEDKDSFEDENGCPEPDNDDDGLLDADDKCASEAEDKDGFEDADGCPDYDNDGDGIADGADKCPGEAEDKDGFRDGDGCPEPDNDADGLNDLGDLCPNNPEDKDGVEDDDGCPEDNDKDGIPDADDKCPNKAETYNGIDDDDGCPEQLKVKSLVEVTDTKIDIKEKIFFKTNSAVILAKSFGLLDQVASVLKNYKHITKVRVEGHTDSTGNRKRNIKLSRDRAESVRKYLIGKGIEERRLEAEGYGPDKPIGSNKSAHGKEMNRRVEFVIAEQKSIGVDVAEAEKAAEPVIEMPGFEAGSSPAPAPAAAPPPPATDKPLFEMEIGPEPQPAAAPAEKPADKPEKEKKKGKGKKKPESEPEIDFNF